MTWDIKSWIAGIWEGEGGIYYGRRYGDKFYPRVIIYNNDITMLLKVKEFFPNSRIFERKYSKTHKTPNAHTNYALYLNRREDFNKFIIEIVPLVQSEYKKEQIKNVLSALKPKETSS